MARARSVFALVTLVVAATTLAACTPSVSSRTPQDPFGAPVVPGQGIEEEGIEGTIDAPSPRTGTDTVTVALVGGAQLPTEMAQAFTEETGFSVAVVPIDGVDSLPRAGADVVLGLDGADAQQASQAGTIAPSGPQDTVTLSGTSISGVPAAVAYGRDDVCVIADKSWMSANKRTLPTSFQELSTPRVRTLLAVPDPVSSSVGRAFLQEAAAQTGEGLGPFVQTLSPRVDPSLGAAIGAWTAGGHVSDGYLSEIVGSASGKSGSYPLVVAPRSLAAAAVTNTGADSYGTALPSTCIARIMYVAATKTPASDGAESLIAWLQSAVAQHSLATTGAAYPIDGVLAANTKAEWFSGITGSPVVSDETMGSFNAKSAWLATWTAALDEPAPAQTPTQQPSGKPSGQPSGKPSGKPSGQPSVNPGAPGISNSDLADDPDEDEDEDEDEDDEPRTRTHHPIDEDDEE